MTNFNFSFPALPKSRGWGYRIWLKGNLILREKDKDIRISITIRTYPMDSITLLEIALYIPELFAIIHDPTTKIRICILLQQVLYQSVQALLFIDNKKSVSLSELHLQFFQSCNSVSISLGCSQSEVLRSFAKILLNAPSMVLADTQVKLSST